MNYILYDDDADGFGAAYAAWLKFNDAAKYIAVERGDDPPVLPDADEIYIVDFNYPRQVTDALKEAYPKLVVLDHHVTAQKELEGLDYCHFDLTKSAAVIAWNYFLPKESVPVFYGYIQDHDLGKDSLPMTKEVHEAVESYPRTFDDWLRISGVLIPRDLEKESACMEALMLRGVGLRQFMDQRAAEIAGECRMATFVLPNGDDGKILFSQPQPDDENTVTAPVVNASNFGGAACSLLLDRYPDCKMAAFYKDMGNGKRQWGLRSRKDFDCSRIATAFGGGGHKQAAGFTTARDADVDVPAPHSPISAQ